jgi:hypothetical protein
MRSLFLVVVLMFGSSLTQVEAQDVSTSDESQARGILQAAIAKYDAQQEAQALAEQAYDAQEKAKIWDELQSQARARCRNEVAEEPAQFREAAAAGYSSHESMAQVYSDCMKEGF